MVHDLGCTYLQFDDTSLAYLNDPNQRKMMSERGEDAEHLHEAYIRHINEALAGKPDGITITTHMCRGNFRSSWVAEGGYDFVAEALFGELGVDGFFLEYDDARSGGFEPLRFVPKGKWSCSGWSRRSAASSRRRTSSSGASRRPSQYVDLDQLCLSRAVRLLVDGRGQQRDLRPAGGEARADRRGGQRGLGLSGRRSVRRGRPAHRRDGRGQRARASRWRR